MMYEDPSTKTLSAAPGGEFFPNVSTYLMARYKPGLELAERSAILREANKFNPSKKYFKP